MKCGRRRVKGESARGIRSLKDDDTSGWECLKDDHIPSFRWKFLDFYWMSPKKYLCKNCFFNRLGIDPNRLVLSLQAYFSNSNRDGEINLDR